MISLLAIELNFTHYSLMFLLVCFLAIIGGAVYDMTAKGEKSDEKPKEKKPKPKKPKKKKEKKKKGKKGKDKEDAEEPAMDEDASEAPEED